MMRFCTVCLFVCLCIGCSSDEQRMLDHYEQVARILEQNHQSPTRAAEKLDAYWTENSADILERLDRLDKKSKNLSQNELLKYQEAWSPQLSKIMERIMRIATSRPFQQSETFQRTLRKLKIQSK